MNRRHFIKNSCVACMGAVAASGFLSACSTTRYVPGKIEKDGISVDPQEFVLKDKGKYRSYIVIRNDALLFPICLYRLSETDYSALWMQCSHQGAELAVSGDKLQCPAHGSEYSNRGKVTGGPADRDIRSFPVSIIDNQVFIDLRKA